MQLYMHYTSHIPNKKYGQVSTALLYCNGYVKFKFNDNTVIIHDNSKLRRPS